jgi:hypothetical protein
MTSPIERVAEVLQTVLLDHMGEHADDEDGQAWAGYVSQMQAHAVVDALGLTEEHPCLVHCWPSSENNLAAEGQHECRRVP